MERKEWDGKSILIADDEEYVRRHLAKRLEAMGLTVFQAGTGIEVLEGSRKRPNLIVMDVKMPELDGLETTRRLKDDEETRDIPVILLSAMTRSDEVTEGMTAGAAGYLMKPITFDRFMNSVREHIG
jgi:CheY-like chemotaxis protein